jgi:hypothetical protein
MRALKRRYDDDDDTLDTKVMKRIQRVNSDRLRAQQTFAIKFSIDDSRSSSVSTPTITPQLSLDPFFELQEKTERNLQVRPEPGSTRLRDR